MRAFKIFVVCFIFAGLGTPACAQMDPSSLGRRITRALAKTSRFSVENLSHRAHTRFLKRLSPIFKKPRTAPLPEQNFIPAKPKPISFLVQSGPKSPETASAFAIKIENKLFGVTAGHVMNNIKNFDPRMSLSAGKERVEFSISTWRMSNRKGSDVAIFEIPQEALPYIQPLEISLATAEPWQTASIAGHAYNLPVWLTNEEILFVGPQRMLLRNTSKKTLFGMCGSPVMINDKVVGLYVGYDTVDNLARALWADPIREAFGKQLPPLHRVAPIEHIYPLIESITSNANTSDAGKMMQVLGKPVARIKTNELLYSLTLVRNDRAIRTINFGPLVDPEHLEQFFELQENDELMVTVLPDGYPFAHKQSIIYKVNVSTGKVEKIVR